MNLPIDLKDSKMNKRLIIIAVSVVFLLVYLNFVMKPLLGRLTNTFSKTGKIGAELRKAESDVSQIGKSKSDVASYKEKVDRYEKMLPAGKEIPALLENLSEMAKSSNIKIVGITPVGVDEQNKGDIYQEVPILISAKSGYHELGTFLSKLENSDRFMKIVDIEIRANRSAPKKHDVEVIVCTYILLNQ